LDATTGCTQECTRFFEVLASFSIAPAIWRLPLISTKYRGACSWTLNRLIDTLPGLDSQEVSNNIKALSATLNGKISYPTAGKDSNVACTLFISDPFTGKGWVF